MKANKIITVIKIETLSTDSVPALLAELSDIMRKENANGDITKEDGDAVVWTQKSKPVEF